MDKWRVYLRRDGKTERTVDDVLYLGRCAEVWRTVKESDIYEYTDIMPATHEIFADYSETRTHG